MRDLVKAITNNDVEATIKAMKKLRKISLTPKPLALTLAKINTHNLTIHQTTQVYGAVIGEMLVRKFPKKEIARKAIANYANALESKEHFDKAYEQARRVKNAKFIEEIRAASSKVRANAGKRLKPEEVKEVMHHLNNGTGYVSLFELQD
ncbi:hypothetical protein HUU53_00915 [Candidatus Micrarchaeota archaeon]|nr:hypothetical protein [Candidatus Micrarchaeota archaeon]